MNIIKVTLILSKYRHECEPVSRMLIMIKDETFVSTTLDMITSVTYYLELHGAISIYY